ncbi:DUF5677 domain-containing protein [Xanthomonas euvesicatoria]|uniref:DUF5677 domain-containing protein n=1 Tax=Xanthomonas euvesicatoria TaxID=456327 RepID=UPI001C4817A8|nr:DUF5677 domain-containing protein [Xanthomonas euvesicatoria]MBV6805585.1 hypothetical protein [Xanthomonas campestris pv. convolvuli]
MQLKYIDPINGRGAHVERMLAQHAEALEITRTLATEGERFVAGLTISTSDPLQLIPSCLLLRQLAGLRSLALLAANGFYTEALGHQRSLMEALARLSALIAQPDLLQDYLYQDVLNRKKLLGHILNFRQDWSPDMVREPSDEELQEGVADAERLLADFKAQHGRAARDVKTLQWAEIGGVVKLLYGRFVIASEALHFSPKSLDSLLVAEGETLKSIRIGPEDKDLNYLLITSCKYVFVGIQLLANHLVVERPEQIELLYLRFDAFYARMADEALGAD